MTSQLRVRREQAPDNAVFVVRGGLLEPTELRRAARLCHERFGVFGLSVLRADDEDGLDELARSRLAAYRVMSITTAGVVRAAGLELQPTFRRPHYTLVLPDLDDGIAKLLAISHEVRQNRYHSQAQGAEEE